jgi:hypothetical protein
VDAVSNHGGRATAVQVASSQIGADLVIDASGRAGRVTDGLRPAPSVGGNCGIAYVDRQYQLWPDAEPGPLLNPAAWQGEFDGYLSILFLHERGIYSVLLVRPAPDPSPMCFQAELSTTTTVPRPVQTAASPCPGWSASATPSAPPHRTSAEGSLPVCCRRKSFYAWSTSTAMTLRRLATPLMSGARPQCGPGWRTTSLWMVTCDAAGKAGTSTLRGAYPQI